MTAYPPCPNCGAPFTLEATVPDVEWKCVHETGCPGRDAVARLTDAKRTFHRDPANCDHGLTMGWQCMECGAEVSTAPSPPFSPYGSGPVTPNGNGAGS